MSVFPRGFECRPQPPMRGGCESCPAFIYRPPHPRCGQPREQPFQRATFRYSSGPSNAPRAKPCCYDLPCKAHCFNHDAYTRPSGRYARTCIYPGECPPRVPPCQAFTCPNPPYHQCCYYTCNRHV